MREQQIYRTESILAALKETGGLIIAKRQTGKTMALLRFIKENPRKFVLVEPSDGQCQYAKDLWLEMYGKKFASALKVITAGQIEAYTRGLSPEVKLLLDEWWYIQLPKGVSSHWVYAMVGAPEMPVTVIS